MFKKEIIAKLESVKCRSAWEKGVREYALDLAWSLPSMEDITGDNLRTWCLNGADNWSNYSWGGCSLIYDADIAQRLCTPSELRRTQGGLKKPNSREEWLDVQTRALAQAYYMIRWSAMTL